ncbi:hypothetical protein TEA_007031 [Camellia sinensis var. sinensis]|uniref:RING-type domain-containing protein n=1 Tax=Camellia sinensis var. sinensis TaxID=542762 RepID=A0A4S4D9B8_CAMSN|nr:hypothetical protein TEA_007031 [Camellia sinensis var. sinensis]
MCSQMVNPVMEAEMMMIKCPLCHSGFVEEMDSPPVDHHHPFPNDYYHFGGGSGGRETRIGTESESESDHALSLWAPILLGMMSNHRGRRRFRRRRLEFEDEYYEEDESGNNNNNSSSSSQQEGESELDRELESIIRRRRRSSATILQLLHGIRAGMLSESDNSESENRDRNRDRNTNEITDREGVILINPFNQTIKLVPKGGGGGGGGGGGSGSSYDYSSNNSRNHQNHNPNPIGSLGDYFIGPGLDLLLQHLAENDPNRYGTPPAQKEAVDAMPTVKIAENMHCCVCLEDFEIGTEAKEMPCISCLQMNQSLILMGLGIIIIMVGRVTMAMAALVKKRGERDDDDNDDGRNGNGRQFSLPLPWPLSSLFTLSSRNGNGNSNFSSATWSSMSASSTNAARNASNMDDEN